MNNIKRFIKNRKAISPIFATLILIAIAVIAGVVVYMFTSGTLATMTGGGTAAQEKVSVQGVQATTTTTGTVYAQNQGTSSVTVTSIMFKNAAGNVVSQFTPASGTTIGANSMGSLAYTGITALATNTPYTATVVTANGGSFVSASFTVPA